MRVSVIPTATCPSSGQLFRVRVRVADAVRAHDDDEVDSRCPLDRLGQRLQQRDGVRRGQRVPDGRLLRHGLRHAEPLRAGELERVPTCVGLGQRHPDSIIRPATASCSSS
jgi:hypothetical protein